MASRVDSWQQAGNRTRRKACGECRRLKLRCEKVFPCESCQKRGCAAICPEGSFMKGTRSLKTSALKLHEKMAQMSARIHELEEALARIQASVSAEPHPLLQPADDDDERSKSPIPIAALIEASIPPTETPDDLAEALGTLTIRPFGESQFHGDTASSEYLLQVNSDQHILATHGTWDQNPRVSKLPPDLILFSVLFPFPPSIMGEPVGTDRFLPFLPAYPEALRISDVYFNHFSWCSLPVSQDELHDILTNEIYIDTQQRLPHTLDKISLHRLAVVLMVFAVGCLFDLQRPVCSTDAEDYHSLARAALCGEQIFNSTSIECVQAMSLMVWYMRMCPGKRSTGYLWSFSGLLSKLVQAIGLHREPTMKFFSPAEIVRRQTTFWEYISGDVWQSFVFGRPSSMVFSQIDCRKPREVPGHVGAPQGLFYRWKYGFTNLVGDVLSLTTGATATNYKGICELERKIREYPIPAELHFPEDASPNTLFEEEPITQTLQRFIIRLWQNATIMYIHRRFVVQAIRMNAEDPAKSIYGQSVHSAFDSACKHVQDLITLYTAHPRLVSRMHPYWTHSFSAAIVLGALVARSPSCGYALDAMHYLKEALLIFNDGQGRTVQPPTAVEVLTNLHRKAEHALSQRESFRHEQETEEQHISEEYVALGALGQVLEPVSSVTNVNGGAGGGASNGSTTTSHNNGSPARSSSARSNGNGEDYVSPGYHRSHNNTHYGHHQQQQHNNHNHHHTHRGLPTSPTDIYHHHHQQQQQQHHHHVTAAHGAHGHGHGHSSIGSGSSSAHGHGGHGLSSLVGLGHQDHAAHAEQWMRQQAYFPSRNGGGGSNGSGSNGVGGFQQLDSNSAGLDVADTPSSNGTGYDVVPGLEGQADWQHGFMESMGV